MPKVAPAQPPSDIMMRMAEIGSSLPSSNSLIIAEALSVISNI